jgi:Tetratricopeptide repeat/Protein of unknown function (DUF2914)
MSELPDVARMLEAAEQAARAENLALADELLRRAADIQEVELGPLHPDLANTLNNLAIVAEKTGRLDEAETFYRRAVAITSASLPADHPMITASRENLEDFCRARGLPIDKPTEVHAVDAGLTTEATPQPSIAPLPVPEQRTPSASEPLLSGSRRVSRSLAWAAIGVVVVATATFLLMRRPSPARETPTTGPTTERPVEQAQPPTVVPQTEDRSGPRGAPSGRAPSSGAITLATAQLCRTFSTAGAIWRCDPIVDAVSRGPIVLYTRVRSPRDDVVVHRWYQGDTLRQSVKLTIRANATEGYRTYSRQTVDEAADWRVEVRSANGDLLHERHFAVR